MKEHEAKKKYLPKNSFFLSAAIISISSFILVSYVLNQKQAPENATQAAVVGNDFSYYDELGTNALQSNWYNAGSGQWRVWWVNANAVESLINSSVRTNGRLYKDVIDNVYTKNASGKFLNHYYDDEGWWGNAWVRAYDLTGNPKYLSMAKTIFNDMKGGWDATCGGGIWWNKDRNYKNAIPNELFLLLAIRLHQRTPADTDPGSYLDWATREWNWFNSSGMINSSNVINDGLTSSCQNNGRATYTYNQGVILAGLTDLYRSTGTTAYLQKAQSIADSAITRLVNSNGILVDPCEAGSCGQDGQTFKGIFYPISRLPLAKLPQTGVL